MAANQYNTGGYGFNPLDPQAEFMTNDLMTRPATDPTYDSAFTNNYMGASTPAEVAAAGLRRDDVPGAVVGSVAGALSGYAGGGLLGLNQNQSANFLGGAGGPNVAGNAQVAKPAQQPVGNTPTNDQYINTGTSWVRNPDYNPLLELRGGAMQAYQQDNSIANKMGYQDNGFNYQREDPFAGQNLNDASVQFHLKQYMEKNPGFVPINTYRGEAPRLPGQINQDTGQMTTEQGSYNPWAGNTGFVQPMPWQGQQQQQAPYQAPQAQQQQNPYLQPFQQTAAYGQSVNQNWGGQVQNPYRNQQRQPQGYQQPQQGLLQRFQGQQQQQTPQGNRYGLLSAYGAR